jgi:hypothetical protein
VVVVGAVDLSMKVREILKMEGHQTGSNIWQQSFSLFFFFVINNVGSITSNYYFN